MQSLYTIVTHTVRNDSTTEILPTPDLTLDFFMRYLAALRLT